MKLSSCDWLERICHWRTLELDSIKSFATLPDSVGAENTEGPVFLVKGRGWKEDNTGCHCSRLISKDFYLICASWANSALDSTTIFCCGFFQKRLRCTKMRILHSWWTVEQEKRRKSRESSGILTHDLLIMMWALYPCAPTTAALFMTKVELTTNKVYLTFAVEHEV